MLEGLPKPEQGTEPSQNTAEREPTPTAATETLKPMEVKNRGEAISRILETFRREQEENYGNLDFHNEHHPEGVRHEGLRFLKIIRGVEENLVSKEDLGTLADAASAHDSVLRVANGEMIRRFRGFFDTDIPPDLKKLMEEQGVTEGNERASANRLLAEMDRYVGPDGKPVFDAATRQTMREAIAATFPDFDFKGTVPEHSPELEGLPDGPLPEGLERYRTGLKAWQPHLKPESSLVTLALAEADLRGEVAANDPERFRQSGNAEFRELSVGIRRRLERGIENLSQAERTEIAGKILDWTKTQVTFGMWQKVLFWEAIGQNRIINESTKREEIKSALAKAYNANFNTSILAAKERYETLEQRYGRFEDAEGRKGALDGMTNDDCAFLLLEIGYKPQEYLGTAVEA